MTLSDLYYYKDVYNKPYLFAINWESALAPDKNFTVGIGILGYLFAVSLSGRQYICAEPKNGWNLFLDPGLINAELQSKATINGNVKFNTVAVSNSDIALIYSNDDDVNFRYKETSGSQNWTSIRDIVSSINSLRMSFRDGCNSIVEGLTGIGFAPSSNIPWDIRVAIQQVYDERYSVGYNAGYYAGHTAYTPQILEGTSNATRNATSYSLDVQIPAGFAYVCAGITGVQDASGYDDSATWKLWGVSTSWSYNPDTGVVNFNIGVGGGTYAGSNAKISYRIMYVG